MGNVIGFESTVCGLSAGGFSLFLPYASYSASRSPPSWAVSRSRKTPGLNWLFSSRNFFLTENNEC